LEAVSERYYYVFLGLPSSRSSALGYIPNKAAAVIFCAVYAVVAIHGTWMMFRTRGKYMATLVVSGYVYALGLILRLRESTLYDSIGPS
jgi:hypothetical protein